MIERTTIVTAQITEISKSYGSDVDGLIESPEDLEKHKKRIEKHLKEALDVDDVVVTIQDFINDEAKFK
jgi:hypothetical protein